MSEPLDNVRYRIVCGGRWTVDGRWVVVANCEDSERIVFDPDNADGAFHWPDCEGPPEWASWLDLKDCREFIERIVNGTGEEEDRPGVAAGSEDEADQGDSTE